LDVRHVILHTDRYPAGRGSEMQAALAQVGDLAPVATFGADQVYRVQSRRFDPDDVAVQGYFPPRAAAGQPYTAYAIAINGGPRSYAVQPTDVVQPTVAWEAAGESTTTVVEADIPLVISAAGGAAVIPLRVTAPLRPGTYHVTIRSQEGPLGAWIAEGTVEVGEQGDSAFPVPVKLADWSVPPTARPGQPLQVGLTWQALGKIDAYYSVYVKLLDAGGSAIAGWDGQPRDGAAPTLLWVPGETIDDSVTLVVPADAPSGEYAVEVGMYRAEDLVRVLTLNPQGVPVDRTVLGSVRIGP
jgi:hypothetical protein